MEGSGLEGSQTALPRLFITHQRGTGVQTRHPSPAAARGAGCHSLASRALLARDRQACCPFSLVRSRVSWRF